MLPLYQWIYLVRPFIDLFYRVHNTSFKFIFKGHEITIYSNARYLIQIFIVDLPVIWNQPKFLLMLSEQRKMINSLCDIYQNIVQP